MGSEGAESTRSEQSPAISVVMATYNTGERLRDTLASLAAQSLPAGRFEVVIVDDGSSDGTPALIEELAAEGSNIVVSAIEHTGWPGRARNVGTAMARGEYVLFMDHDDDLFPEALERMYAYAHEHDADVLLAKEVIKGGGTPGWSTWKANDPAVERIDQRVLECMTPHKLYRRKFMQDKAIAFPEGAVRLEDYYLNALAYVRAERVAILADYPCYRWIIHATNAHKGRFDLETYWRSFDASLQVVESELPAGRQQDEMLLRWYTSRVLRRVGVKLGTYPDGYRTPLMPMVFASLRHFPERLDVQLSMADRVRSRLLREQRTDLLMELSSLDNGASVHLEPAIAHWHEGTLSVSTSGTLHAGTGAPIRFVPEGGGIARELPEPVRSALRPEDVECGAELAGAEVELSVRGRTSAVEWAVPSKGTVTLQPDGDGFVVRVEVSGTISPRTGAFGVPLADDVWDVAVRLRALGFEPRVKVPLASTSGRALPALVDGAHLVAYRTTTGLLALDVGAQLRTVPGSADPAAEDVHAEGRELVIDLPGVHVHGETTIPGTVLIGPDSTAAELIGDAQGARVRTRPGQRVGVPLRAARLETRFLGRKSKIGLQVRRKLGGTVIVTKAPLP